MQQQPGIMNSVPHRNGIKRPKSPLAKPQSTQPEAILGHDTELLRLGPVQCAKQGSVVLHDTHVMTKTSTSKKFAIKFFFSKAEIQAGMEQYQYISVLHTALTFSWLRTFSLDCTVRTARVEYHAADVLQPAVLDQHEQF